MDKDTSGNRSTALLLAQERLLALQAELGVAAAGSRQTSKCHQPTPPSGVSAVSSVSGSTTSPLPSHLGWGSDPLTKQLRQKQRGRSICHTSGARSCYAPSPSSFQSQLPKAAPLANGTYKIRVSHTSSKEAPAVKLYPDIALALLRKKQTAAGRVWLLLTHLDTDGRGWFHEEEIRAQIGSRNSAMGICGPRQLRALLARGEGLFWTRSNGRIWLRSLAKIASSLGVTRLNSSPVALPLSVLKQSIGQVRSHLYASFHSGRMNKQKNGKPISRATLRQLSAVSRNTQLKYETRSGVVRRPNFAIGGRKSDQEIKELAWKHGRALFTFIDKKGILGSRGQSYAAWRLPNSYSGPHQRQPVGRRRRINQELADLFKKGMTGNGSSLDSSRSFAAEAGLHLYHDNGAAAVSAYNRDPLNDTYWQGQKQNEFSHQLSNEPRQLKLWFVLPGKDPS